MNPTKGILCCPFIPFLPRFDWDSSCTSPIILGMFTLCHDQLATILQMILNLEKLLMPAHHIIFISKSLDKKLSLNIFDQQKLGFNLVCQKVVKTTGTSKNTFVSLYFLLQFQAALHKKSPVHA